MAKSQIVGPEDLARLVARIAAGEPIHSVAETIGYSTEQLNKAVASPTVRAAVAAALQARLLVEGAAAALDTLITITRDPTVARRERIEAAKALLRSSGIAAAPGEQAKREIDLTAMSREELAMLARGAESELATRADPVSTPDPAPALGQPTDIFS